MNNLSKCVCQFLRIIRITDSFSNYFCIWHSVLLFHNRLSCGRLLYGSVSLARKQEVRYHPRPLLASGLVSGGSLFCSTILHSMVRCWVGRACLRNAYPTQHQPRPHWLPGRFVSGGSFFLGIEFALVNQWSEYRDSLILYLFHGYAPIGIGSMGAFFYAFGNFSHAGAETHHGRAKKTYGLRVLPRMRTYERVIAWYTP
jgi:hypothetical protein